MVNGNNRNGGRNGGGGAQTKTPTIALQGVLVPQTAIRPREFFARTRGMHIRQATSTFDGFGSTLNTSILQTGIIGGIDIHFSGTLTVTDNAGSVDTTARWPYDLLRGIRFSANGQSNLINCRGWKLKAREFMQRADLTDRGIERTIDGSTVDHGTLSLHNEEWGVGQDTTGVTEGEHDIHLSWHVPVAFDRIDLLGAIFAQTSSTDLNLTLDVAPQADVLSLNDDATVTLAGDWTIEADVFTIPQDASGEIVVPDLSVFHSIIETRNTAISTGTNEIRLAGQGVGRQLQRVWFQLQNGGSPLALDDANFGQLGWRFGGNDTPQVWDNGRHLAYTNERLFGSDYASHQGIGIFDWASEHAFRDSIDEGAATELRLLVDVDSSVDTTNPALEYVQETFFSGAVGA